MAEQRTALITGASAGIGAAFAEVFAAEGWNLVLVARREDRLRALADRLTAASGISVTVIAADLADPRAAQRIVSKLALLGVQVDALVNNAGYGVPGAYLRSPWSRHDAMLHVMVTCIAELTYLVLPGMVERGYGRIINIASLAGLVPSPGGHTLYAATKAFVIKFSEALGHEVRAKGVYVTALCPGFTYSEFHDVTGTREQMTKLPRWLWLDAPTVARQGYDAAMAGAPLHINGRVNRTIAALVKYAPQWLVRSVEKRLGHRKLE
jgi:short-subunit dehydrogenase